MYSFCDDVRLVVISCFLCVSVRFVICVFPPNTPPWQHPVASSRE